MDAHASSSSGSVLSQLQHEIGDAVVNSHLHNNGYTNGNTSHLDADDDAVLVDGPASTVSLEDDVDDLTASTSSAASGPQGIKKKVSTIDLNNTELFPSLPTAAGTGKPIPAWRAPPPAAPKSATSSTTAASSKKVAGKVTERLDIPFNMHAKLPGSGKGSVGDHVKNVTLRTQTVVEISTNRATNVTSYIISGKIEAVKQARKELVQALGVQTSVVIMVPVSVRPHLFGSGGKNLKDLTARTGAKIDVPRIKEGETTSAENNSVDEEEHPVTVSGNFEAVRLAKDEIEALVIKRTSKLSLRINVDRSYHPFIAGPNNANVEKIEAETSARVHIPPFNAEKNVSEINVVGSKEAVRAAEEIIKAQYEELQRNTTTLSLSVKKRQHRFIVGPKGANLQEILQATGCTVELPPSTDPSDQITVRGPGNMLSVALQLVFQKSNEVSFEEINVAPLLPKTTDVSMFMKFLFTKERAEVRKIESAHNVTIHQMPAQGDATTSTVIEIQGKNKPDVDVVAKTLTNLVRELGIKLYLTEVEIPNQLHKFVVGKGGQNITKLKSNPAYEGRLVDIAIPDQADETDTVLLVIQRKSPGLAAAPKAKSAQNAAATQAAADAASAAEAKAFAEKIRDEVLAAVQIQADFVSEVVPVPNKYHGRLIGAGGDKLRELLGAYASDVSIKFPPAKDSNKKEASAEAPKKSAIDPDTVVIKGPKNLVAEVKTKVLGMVADLKHIEVLTAFSDSIKVKKGLAKKVVLGPMSAAGEDRGPGGVGWLIRAVKEAFAANPVAHAKPGDAPPPDPALALLRVDIEAGTGDQETLVISGPKSAVAHAKKILAERAAKLAESAVVDVKLFEEVSAAARAEIAAASDPIELKKRVLRRIIGREGKGVKAVMEKHGVAVRFPEGGRRKKAAAALAADEDVDDDVKEEDAEVSAVDGVAVIKGSKKDVEAARADILKSVENELIRSYSLSFDIPKVALPHIVGASGSKIRVLKEEHDVRVDFLDVDRDGEPAIEVVVEGNRKGCAAVQKKIEAAVDELVNIESLGLPIPNYLHKDIIGGAGARIKALIDSFGGPDKVKVQFPARGDSVIGGPGSNVVTLKAHSSVIAKLKKAVTDLTAEILSTNGAKHALIDESAAGVVVQTCEVAKNDVSRILGRSGDNVKDVMRRHHVIVWVSEVDEDDTSAVVSIRVVGKNQAGVAAALDDIKGKLRVSKEVPIPEKVLANLATAGSTHDMEYAALQEIIKKVRAESNGATSAELSAGAGKGKAGSVIVVRGDAKLIDASVSSVTKNLEELTKYEFTTQVSVAAELRPHIIGKAGATINRIRTETGASVEVGGSGRGGSSKSSSHHGTDTVVIRGSKAAVEAAQAAINRIIEDQKVKAARDNARTAAAAEKAAASSAAAAAAASSGPARIDDDVPAVSSEPVGTTIPGYTPRLSTQRNNDRKKAPVVAAPTVGVATASTSYDSYVSTLEKSGQGSWQDVKKKGKKGESEEPAAAAAKTVPGAAVPQVKEPEPEPVAVVEPAPATQEKSKKKKGGAEPPTSLPTFNLSFPHAKTPVPSPATPFAPNMGAYPFPASSGPTPRPVGVQTPAQPSAPATAPVAKPAAAPVVVETEAEDDGWTTVNTVKKGKASAAPTAAVLAAAPAAVESESGAASAAKKKKKNKKKKKASATGTAADGDDSGDE